MPIKFYSLTTKKKALTGEKGKSQSVRWMETKYLAVDV